MKTKIAAWIVVLLLATVLFPALGSAELPPVVDSMQLKYASGFAVDYLEGGYKLITDGLDRQFLLVPEGADVPEVDEGIAILQAPLTSIGCFSTPHAVLFKPVDQLDKISMVCSDRDRWYIEQIRDQIDAGTTVYIGKNTAPDYELISAVAPQITLITAALGHSASDVLLKLDELGIPWFAAQEHMENNPLGRLEWGKLAAALVDEEEAAEAFFDEQEAKMLAIADKSASMGEGPTVNQPFVYKGIVYIRKDDDYVNSMIRMAGGVNVVEGIAPGESGTMTVSVEEYYKLVADLDVLIYDNINDVNAKTISDIVAYGDYLADVKAIKNGNVWGIQPHYYQSADDVATMVEELNRIFYDPDNATDLKYYYKLEP